MSTVVVTGASGLLGRHLLPRLDTEHRCVPVGHQGESDRADLVRLDLRQREGIHGLLDRVQPDAIVHAAALADVEACERAPDAAYAANVQATRHIADWVAAAAPETHLLYVSTDAVYGGDGPHVEDETPVPLNTYALTKLWGEEWALRAPSAAVLRINFVCADGGLGQWVVTSLMADKPVTLFEDVLFTPLHAAQLADVVAAALARRLNGTFNVGCNGGLSKATFALAVADRLGRRFSHATIGRVGDADLAARRPRDMRLSVERLERGLGRALPAVDEVVERLCAEVATADAARAAAV